MFREKIKDVISQIKLGIFPSATINTHIYQLFIPLWFMTIFVIPHVCIETVRDGDMKKWDSARSASLIKSEQKLGEKVSVIKN